MREITIILHSLPSFSSFNAHPNSSSLLLVFSLVQSPLDLLVMVPRAPSTVTEDRALETAFLPSLHFYESSTFSQWSVLWVHGGVGYAAARCVF